MKDNNSQIKDIFNKENIFIIEEKIHNKELLFERIAQKAKSMGYVESEKACYEGLVARENEQTTGFQDGFAIPHCKDDTVIKPTLLIFKTQPIEWDSLDGEPIEFSFVLLVPEEASKEHLKILAKIAKSLIDKDYRKKLKKADQQTIYKEVLKKLEE